MVYLFLGSDLPAKDAGIAEIKNKFFKNSREALSFDFDNLDAGELGADTLKQAFLTLPVIAPRRLIILRRIHKLKSADIRVLINFCQKPAKHCDVVLESAENTLKGDLKDLTLLSKGVLLAGPEGPNVFDMTKLVTAHRSGDALKMLDGFYRADVHPLAVMGALVWYWGREGKLLGKERFERGLKALEEADLNIKRSRLDPQYAVEKLVVELGQLLLRRREGT
jgi:DNA polymerase III delta subunit